MAKKSFNQQLQDIKDMPKISELTDPKAESMYGGTKLLIAPLLAYDEIQTPYWRTLKKDGELTQRMY